MSQYVQLTTTTATRQDAERIAAALVSRRLAACVQVGGPVTSTYRWQGKVEISEEWMCIIKTGRGQIDKIQQVFDEIHPYDVPELIATAIVGGSEAYLHWLGEQLEQPST